jgi:ribose transport system substrate-binding protein
MKLTRRLALLAAAAAVAALPSCSSKSSGKPKVGVVTNCTAEFWSISEAGAKKAGTDFDVDVDFRQPVNNTVTDQMDIVNAMVQRGLDGLAVSVINPQEQSDALRGVAGKAKFITMDNDAPNSGRICYIGIDNYEAGKALARLIKAGMPAGGTVALFIGSTASANAQARIGGVLDELAGTKGAPREPGSKLGQFTLDGIYTDDTDQTRAQDRAGDVLEKLRGTPNVCMVGLYEYNPKAILAAAKAKGLSGKVKIAAFDENAATLQGIRDGDILGTVVQDPFNYGYRSVEVLAGLARGDKSKAVDYKTPSRVVTKAGGEAMTIDGVSVVNIPVDEFAAKLKADLDSVKK